MWCSKDAEVRIAICDTFSESYFLANKIMSYDFWGYYTKILIFTCSRWVIILLLNLWPTNFQHIMIFTKSWYFSLLNCSKYKGSCFALFLEHCTSNLAHQYVIGAKSWFWGEREKSSVLSTIRLLHQAEPHSKSCVSTKHISNIWKYKQRENYEKPANFQKKDRTEKENISQIWL